MLQQALSQTLGQLFSAPFRAVFWRSIGITIALMVMLWFALEAVVSTFLLPILGPWPWATTAITWIFGAGLLVGMGFLIAPVSSLFAGLFLDDIAEAVERKHYANDPPGQPMPVGASVVLTAKFLLLVLGANLIALILALVFGLGVIIFFLLNGYLLGREYFQFAAMRHLTQSQANALRRDNGGTIFTGGLMIACVLALPLVNLLTPLFAGALMVHLFKRLNVRSNTQTDLKLATEG